MGRTTTPTYRVEYKANIGHLTVGAWNSKTMGRPSDENAEKHRIVLNKSFQPGGVNAHCTNADGAIQHCTKVTVIRQRDDKVIAEASAPMFEIV